MLKITVQDDSGSTIMDLTEEQQKAFDHVALSPLEWIRNAIQTRCRRAVDEIVRDNSDKQPEKISRSEKLTIVKDADIKSAKEMNDELEASIGD